MSRPPNLTDAQWELVLRRELARRDCRRAFFRMFPDEGPLRRELYPRHLEFMRLGATHPTRCFMAANRVGKTQCGSFEMTCHLTGRYPDWWEGHRFDHPVDVWMAGDTKETVRDIIQAAMIGPKGMEGTGMVPGDDLIKFVYRQNGNGAMDYAEVRHVSGGVSRVGFKSYDQGREAFQGTAKDAIQLDEESDEGIRSECAMRLMTKNGLLMETFTPLKGLTPVVLTYLGGSQPDETRTSIQDGRAMVMAGWDDAPHLTEEQKRRMLAECEPHLRKSRSKGIPSLGAGAIYPIQEEDILVDDFVIPEHYPRAFALDVGWNNTAAIWGAWDRDSGIIYINSEYKRGQAEPPIHAHAITERGDWIPGVADPAGTNQEDGRRMLDIYMGLGLDLIPANKSVDAGIQAVYMGLSSGQIKIFRSCQKTLAEYRIYRRDEKGRIVKEHDHLMDCLRYLVMSGPEVMTTKPLPKAYRSPHSPTTGAWMGA